MKKCNIWRYFSHVYVHSSSALSCRTYIKVDGNDARSFIQGLCSNDMKRLSSKGQSIATLFLNTKGRIIADSIIYDISNDHSISYIIETYEQSFNDLYKHLSMYKLRSKVVMKKVDMQTVIDLDTSSSQENSDTSSAIISDDPRLSILGKRILSPPASKVISNDNSLNISKFDYLYGLPPSTKPEVTIGHVPFEYNYDILNYICFNKGCYLGQELMARTKFKGRIRKRAVPVFIPSHSPILKISPTLTYNSLKNSFSHLPMDIYEQYKAFDYKLYMEALLSNTSTSDTTTTNTTTTTNVDVINNKESAITTTPHTIIMKKTDTKDTITTTTTQDTKTKVLEVGEIKCIDMNLGLGYAVFDLEALYHLSAETSFYIQTENNEIQIYPYKPIWWPELNQESGHPI